ncbi:MAG: hypothetical protein E7090_04805 [Bacteroidales bacterium]|nr:hypothetical protein [Bacteroidales bacterium]
MSAKQTTKKIYEAPKITVIRCLSAQMLCGSKDTIGGGNGSVDEGGALSNKYRNDWANIWRN